MNKELKIFDKGDVRDKCIKDTKIVLAETGTGKVLFRGSNKVIVSGSEFNALKDFDFSNGAMTESAEFLETIFTYDTALHAENHPLIPYGLEPDYTYRRHNAFSEYDNIFTTGTIDSVPNLKKIYDYFTRRVCLFCVGNDGCGIEASRVFKVHNTKWIAPWGYADYDDGTGNDTIHKDSITNCLIPFKYRPVDSDLSPDLRTKYFGRSVDSNKTAIAYYFKKFDDINLLRRYADDSENLENVEDVWKDSRSAEAEVVVQLKMTIDSSDCREWFNKSTGVNDGKINTISLCTAVPYIVTDKNDNKYLTYEDIRPFTRFNFPNESLVGYNKGIDITYYLYY